MGAWLAHNWHKSTTPSRVVSRTLSFCLRPLNRSMCFHTPTSSAFFAAASTTSQNILSEEPILTDARALIAPPVLFRKQTESGAARYALCLARPMLKRLLRRQSCSWSMTTLISNSVISASCKDDVTVSAMLCRVLQVRTPLQCPRPLSSSSAPASSSFRQLASASLLFPPTVSSPASFFLSRLPILLLCCLALFRLCELSEKPLRSGLLVRASPMSCKSPPSPAQKATRVPQRRSLYPFNPCCPRGWLRKPLEKVSRVHLSVSCFGSPMCIRRRACARSRSFAMLSEK